MNRVVCVGVDEEFVAELLFGDHYELEWLVRLDDGTTRHLYAEDRWDVTNWTGPV